MHGIKEIGKYNVVFAGLVYDKKTPFQLIIFEEFDGDFPVKGSKKFLYFRDNIGPKEKYIMPRLETEADIKKLLKHKNGQKIALKETITEIKL